MRFFLRVSCFFLLMFPAAYAVAEGYLERALFFSYDRYEQVLPYTLQEEEAISPEAGYQLGVIYEKGGANQTVKKR